MEVEGLLKKKKSKKSKAEKKAKKIKKSKKEKRSSSSSLERVQVDEQEKAETFVIPKSAHKDTAKSEPIPSAPPSKPWNDWDSAKFADESRKNKFLRLLGAKKNQSSGSGGGEQKVVDQVKFDRDMEKQFEVGRQMQFGSAGKRSSGLGSQYS